MLELLALLDRTPHAPLLSDAQETLTYQQVVRAVTGIIDILSAQNGRVVALLADNQMDWILVDLACQQMGLCCIPLPLFFSDAQLKHAIAQANVDVVVTDQPARLAKVSGLSDATAHIGQLGVHPINGVVSTPVMPAGTSKITFTSGSTGAPKGVCLTQAQQWDVAQSLCQVAQQTAPRHLCVTPLSTLLENIAGVYAPIFSGGCIEVRPLQDLGFNGGTDFALERLLQTVSQVQPNTMIVPPQLLLGLVGGVANGWVAPSTLQFIAVGGGKVSPHLIAQAQQVGLPVYEGYGLSECASVVSLNTPQAHRPGSVGKPLPHANVRIVDHEVVVAEQVFLGYLNEPASWQQREVATGDLGRIDAEGYLYIDGRAKQVLISSFGRNIHPEWVESHLLCGPLLQQCVVFGDAQPYCIALLYPRSPNSSDAQIQQWLDARNALLPDYARIRHWLRLSQPLTAQAGLLTNNGRPRRLHIAEHFHHDITALYQITELSA